MFTMQVPVHVTGGMEIHAAELAKGVAKAGHQVELITSAHPQGLEHEVVDGYSIHYVDSTATSRRPLGRQCLAKFTQLNRENGFDVVHSQSIAALSFLKEGYREKTGLPFISSIHGTNYGEIRSNLNQGLSPMLAPKIAYQLWCHHTRSRPLLAGSDKAIAVSREVRDALLAEYDLAPEKVRTINNGIDTERFKPGKRVVKEGYEGKKIILSVSVLHKQKGIQYLIQAMKKIKARMPDARLIVLGDGPYRESLKRMTQDLGLTDVVTFKGNIPNKDIMDYYNACDVFVIPTVRVEGLPLIELEAMACAKPVVASDIGGIPSVIDDEENGLLVKPADTGGLADSIMRVLSEPDLMKRLGESARKTIEEGFSRDKMVAGTIKVYSECVR